MIHDQYPLSGRVRVMVFDGDLPFADDPQILARFIDSGEAEQQAAFASEWKNLVTNVGRQQRVRLITDEESTGLRAIGLTTSNTTASLGLTALTNEIARNSLTVKETISTYTERYIAYFTTSDFGSTGLAGAGAFDATSTGGNMYMAASISASKSTTQGLVLEWQVTASS